MDLAIQFCERCGRDRDAFTAARASFRDCPGCGSACCPDCWNLVEGACLACAPFRLRADTSRSWVVPVAPAPGPAATSAHHGTAPAGAAAESPPDPYADLRDAPGTTQDVDPFGRPVGSGILGTWETSRATARQRPREAPAAGAAPALASSDAWRAVVAETDPPPPPRRRRRRGGRVAVAAVASWVFVGALAVAALGAGPGSTAALKPTPAPATPAPTAAPTPTTPSPAAAPTQKPKPKPQKAPKATAKPVRRVVAVPPAATSRPARSTPRPAKPPAVVTPPPIAPPPLAPPESTTP